MTSNYKKKIPITVTQEEYTAALKAEVRELYNKIDEDISAQILALALVCLEINYGWKQRRLRKFVGNLHAMSDFANANVLGKSADTRVMVKHLKDKYGIDLRQEVSKM